METKPKVLLGMSGGVDSAVSAVLLLEQGYEVIGAFMKNWSGDVNGPECKNEERVGSESEECGWKMERRDAMRVAAQLGISFITFDFEKEYRRDVVEYMFREFESGRTPNPDVMCNRFIKFDLFLQEANKLGCDFIATGHYAQIVSDSETPSHPDDNNGLPQVRILKGVDSNKDQTYFLWAINKKVLSCVLFPIGHLYKPEVRKIAKEHHLEVATKKDSTGICFVGEVDMRDFLKSRMPENPGDIVTTEGKIIGTHVGINFYTIGQRHGLEIGGGDPYYVIEKNVEKNELIVGSNFHPALFKKELTASQLNWFRFTPPSSRGELAVRGSEEPSGSRREGGLLSLRCTARIRHRQPVQDCLVFSPLIKGGVRGGSARVLFNEPQRAITPGQSIVFYDGEEMIGGGIID